MALPSTTSNPPAIPARERILMRADDLFYAEGIRATGVDRVIAEAGVTKATFYRHFPSKQLLVQAFLERRHVSWMAWFDDALARHRDQGAGAVVAALREWFATAGYRGCALINAVVELGRNVPAVEAIARQYKQDMTAAIRRLLPPGVAGDQDAVALALAVDGAIIRAQYADDADSALRPLQRLVKALQAA